MFLKDILSTEEAEPEEMKDQESKAEEEETSATPEINSTKINTKNQLKKELPPKSLQKPQSSK